MTAFEELCREHPEMMHPVRCENGCGAVVELGDAYYSYRRTSDVYGENRNLLICGCCAAEEGHLFEEFDEPEDAPTCCVERRRIQ